jgi:hypothetical protein
MQASTRGGESIDDEDSLVRRDEEVASGICEHEIED